VTDWIFSIIDRLGAVGVGLLVLLENLIPPIPSEVILPLAGFRSRDGAMQPILVWIAATAGSVIGALVLYGLGRQLGYDRLHRLAGKRWFLISSPEDLDHGRSLFDRHGSWVVAGARCIPVLRSLVSLPAGIANMPLPRFVLLTALGSGLWNAAFIAAGWVLADKWQQINQYTGPVSIAIWIAVAIGVAYLAWRKLSRHATEPP
jgi:membrane protein DedA with SNARE-associated domain